MPHSTCIKGYRENRSRRRISRIKNGTLGKSSKAVEGRLQPSQRQDYQLVTPGLALWLDELS